MTEPIEGTRDPELYRYGIHAPELIINLTVGPGQYNVRLRFAATRGIDTKTNCVPVAVNGRRLVSKMDVAATAGGPDRAAELVFNSVNPRNGIICIRLTGGDLAHGKPGEAFVQAVEIGPGQADSKGALRSVWMNDQPAVPGLVGEQVGRLREAASAWARPVA